MGTFKHRPRAGQVYPLFFSVVAVGCLASILLLLSVTKHVEAAIPYIVNSLGDASDLAPGDNLCQTRTGECTLRAAVEESNAFPGADTVLFTNTFPISSSIFLSSPLFISDAVTIQADAALSLTLDARRTTRHFRIDSSDGLVTIANLTLVRRSQCCAESQQNWANRTDSASAPPHLAGESMISASGRSIQIINCTFRDNRNTGNGGAFTVFSATLTIMDSTFINNGADGHSGALYLEDSQLLMSNSIFENNRAAGAAGALVLASSVATITNSTFANNVTNADSGAIHLKDSKLTLSNSIFENNRAAGVAGALVLASSVATITNSTFANNVTNADSGAIHLKGSKLTLTNSLLSNNRATGNGGALLLYSSVATVTHSTFTANQAFTNGGAIHLNVSQLTLINSTLSGNRAGRFGGGIANDNGDNSSVTSNVAIFNSTIVNNRATSGGGLYQAVLMEPSSGIAIANSILAGNLISAADIPNDCATEHKPFPFISFGYNLVVITNATGNCLFNAVGDQAIPLVQLYSQILDPTLSNNGGTPTHALLSSSQAINAGDPTGCKAGNGALLLTDQRGAPRAGRCDIGAYETVLITMSVTSRGTDLEAIRTVTATVYSGELGNPVGIPNVMVGFEVAGGTNVVASKPSALNGQAVFTYTSKSAPTRQLQAEQATDLITVWADFDNNGIKAAGEPGKSASAITFVDLLAFTADANPDGTVTLRWQTAVERDNVGFNLYRSSAQAGPYSQINPYLIAAEGNGTGASYSFIDTPPSPGSYYYRLEDVDTRGHIFQHPPVQSDSKPSSGGEAARLFLSFVQR